MDTIRGNQVEIRAHDSPGWGEIHAWVFARTGWLNEPNRLARLEWGEHNPHSAEQIAPTLRFGREAGQQLLNALWNMGLRPTEHGTPGQLQAMQAHIDDLRVIARRTLGIEPVEPPERRR